MSEAKKGTAMTKTTAEVKRWRHVGSRILETIEPADGEFVLATDYAALQQRCREQATEIKRLNERIEELENPTPSMGELLGISQEK